MKQKLSYAMMEKNTRNSDANNYINYKPVTSVGGNTNTKTQERRNSGNSLSNGNYIKTSISNSNNKRKNADVNFIFESTEKCK